MNGKSARGIAKCEVIVHQDGNGISHGEVIVRLYEQQSQHCTSNVTRSNRNKFKQILNLPPFFLGV
jgi:hypothetical protein